MKTSIAIAETDDEINGCFAVMSELRPQIGREAFLPRVRSQMQGGYRLAYLSDAGEVVACAGFRIFETLAWGRILYVDDLVTAERRRSHGFGARMLDWLLEHARTEGCQQFHLDSGTWRTQAHRFYFRQGLFIKSFHFSRELGAG
jgi:GNAT superfamily N-acetyltransferase